TAEMDDRRILRSIRKVQLVGRIKAGLLLSRLSRTRLCDENTKSSIGAKDCQVVVGILAIRVGDSSRRKTVKPRGFLGSSCTAAGPREVALAIAHVQQVTIDNQPDFSFRL